MVKLLGCGWGVIGLTLGQWSRISPTMHRVWSEFEVSVNCIRMTFGNNKQKISQCTNNILHDPIDPFDPFVYNMLNYN